MFWRVLPNAAPTIIVSASLCLGQVILTEAGLDFSASTSSPRHRVGANMLTSAQTLLYQTPWLVLLSGVAMTGTVLSANILGDLLRNPLDPRLRRADAQLPFHVSGITRAAASLGTHVIAPPVFNQRSCCGCAADGRRRSR